MVIPVTDAERERLGHVMEEMGEAIQICGKILRHGFDSTHPDYDNVSNRHLLERELGHVFAAMDLLVSKDDVGARVIERAREEKHEKVKQYLHYQTP